MFKKWILKPFLIVVFFLSSFLSALTSTEYFLQNTSIETIANTIGEQENGFDFMELYPFFNEIIANENEKLLGYHGTSFSHRVFQDLVKITIEEVRQEALPENFHFLRDPLSEEWVYSKMEDFLEAFAPPPYNEELAKEIIHRFFSEPFKVFFQVPLSLEALNLDLLEEFSRFIYNAYTSHSYIYDEKLLEIVRSIFNEDQSRNYSKEEIDSFIEVYRTGKLVKNALTFTNQIDKLIVPYFDNLPIQQKHLVSINLCLFSYYYQTGESTIHVFARNQSVAKGDQTIETILGVFFERLGINPLLAQELYKKALELPLESQTGTILQLFIKEGNVAEFVEKMTYMATRYGIRDTWHTLYDYKDNDFAYQLRLLMNKTISLNPYGALEIIRYDRFTFSDQEIYKNFLIEARKEIQTQINHALQKNAAHQLEHIWELIQSNKKY